jgi:NitT/TauT family transport system substrate-binding protein
VNADPAGAARNAAAAFGMPPEVIAQAVPHSNLVARRAAEARPALEAMFAEIARRNPALIGGRLPDDAFYL